MVGAFLAAMMRSPGSLRPQPPRGSERVERYRHAIILSLPSTVATRFAEVGRADPARVARSTRAERTMRASTVFPDTLFGPLLADRTPERDTDRIWTGPDAAFSAWTPWMDKRPVSD